MKVIAKKKTAVLFIYILSAFLGLVLLGIAGASMNIFMLIMGVLVIAVSVGIIIDYFRVPTDIISADENNNLYLPRGITLAPAEISDVSYKRATARGVQYKWGTLIISTYSETYKYRYVEDCEAVSKELTAIMYSAKNN